jgi:hypothetical protein
MKRFLRPTFEIGIEIEIPAGIYYNRIMVNTGFILLFCIVVRLVSSVRNELLEAVHTADVDRVRFLLSLDQDVLTSRPPVLVDRLDDSYGRTPLLVCGLDPKGRNRESLGKDCVEIAKMLHSRGADMFHVDSTGWDALSMGAVRGMTQFCRYLLKYHNLDIERKDAEGRTALMKAAAHGYFDTFALLLQHGAKLVNVTDNMGLSALHYGTTFALQNPSQLEFLVNLTSFVTDKMYVPTAEMPAYQSPVPIDTFVDSNSRTCLMYAVISNNIPVSRIFLSVGADPRKIDSFGVSCVTMSRDEGLQNLLAEAAITAVEQDHTAWLKLSSGTFSRGHDDGEEEF